MKRRVQPEVRKASAEIASCPAEETMKQLSKYPHFIFPHGHHVSMDDLNVKYLKKILLKTYERSPGNFESLLGIEGVGPKTIRSQALVSELIFGEKASTRDPAFSAKLKRTTLR
ncbi:DUF763 domain-containing protein [Fibrobacterota bacterium]